MSVVGPGSPYWCDDCYGRHTQERRLAILRRCAHMTREEIQAEWSHFWPLDDSGRRQYRRDRAALREGK